MSLNKVALFLADSNKTLFSLHKNPGAVPESFARLFAAILAGKRRYARDPARLTCMILASSGLDKGASYTLFSTDGAVETDYEWEYRLTCSSRNIHLHLTHNDGEHIKIMHNGPLEFFISKALRTNRLRKTRGPVPRGYANRAEYESVLAARRGNHEELPPVRSNLKNEVMRDRANSPAPRIPNLEGVYVHKPGERKRRG